MNTEAVGDALACQVPTSRKLAAPWHRVAIFAPHLVTPIRNGGDLYIWRKWGSLDPLQHEARLFASDGVYDLTQAGWTRVEGPPRSSIRGKAAAAMHAVLFGTDYLSSRFATPAYRDLVEQHITARPDLAVYSLLSTWQHAAPLVGPGASLVETHNYEPKFYLDRAVEARGAVRFAASMAAVRAQTLLGRLPIDVPLIALGQSDAEMYRALGHRTVLLSTLGYDPHPPRRRFPAPNTVRIAFVAALSVSMNVAAILQFTRGQLQALRRALPSLEVHVAGSRPSARLAKHLQRCGIVVHANPSDELLGELLDSCHATFLPFESSNGMKLKFATSAARGVPILSYIEPPPELAGTTTVLTSRNMESWAAFLRHLANPAALVQAARELQGIVIGRTWRACVEANLDALSAEFA